TPNDPSDDTVTYTPDAGFNGTDSFEYTVCDASGTCGTAIVTVTVGDAMTINAIDDDYSGTPINGYQGGIVADSNVFSNDTLGTAPVNLNDVILSSTPTGPLTINADGTVTVAPNTLGGTYTI